MKTTRKAFAFASVVLLTAAILGCAPTPDTLNMKFVVRELHETNKGCTAAVARLYQRPQGGIGAWDRDIYVVPCDTFEIGDTLTLKK